MIEKNEKQELAREYLGKATPAAQKAFEEGGRILRAHLSSLGYKEVEGLLLKESDTVTAVGIGFYTATLVVYLRLWPFQNEIDLQIHRLKDPALARLHTIRLFPAGFGLFHYRYSERLFDPRDREGIQVSKSYLPENFVSYLPVALASKHLDLILRGKFWHNYFFDFRDWNEGDYTNEDMLRWLRESLEEHGIKD